MSARVLGLQGVLCHNCASPSVNRGGEKLATVSEGCKWQAVTISRHDRASATLLSLRGMWNTRSRMLERRSRSVAVMRIGLYAGRACKVLNMSNMFKLSVRIAKR